MEVIGMFIALIIALIRAFFNFREKNIPELLVDILLSAIFIYVIIALSFGK